MRALLLPAARAASQERIATLALAIKGAATHRNSRMAAVSQDCGAAIAKRLLEWIAAEGYAEVHRLLCPRSFASFGDAAREAAASRLYGGIHYPMGIENGVVQGRAIGRIVDDRLHTRQGRSR